MADGAQTSMTQQLGGRQRQRRRALAVLAAVFVGIGLVWGGYHGVIGRHHVSSDNAYVAGHRVQVTPQTAGTLVSIQVEDTDRVEAGQVIARLDPADARIDFDEARAALAQRVREVRAQFADADALAAQVAQREAQVESARAAAQRLRAEHARRQTLREAGVVSGETLSAAASARAAAEAELAAAQSALRAAREQLASQRLRIDGPRIEDHPAVLEASARLREAWLRWRRCEIVAPVAGYVAQRSAQIGERVEPGRPLLSLVPLDALWVEANLKESQLGKLRIGQSVELVSDLYGSDVRYRGTVAGIGSGTGAAFALLPAQNATGNWIKIVQRVPVRVTLDRAELAAHPLRVGLSMDVDVDVRDQSLPQLATAPRLESVAATAVYERLVAGAEAAAAEIIATNLRAAP